jgi:hypothetical protein
MSMDIGDVLRIDVNELQRKSDALDEAGFIFDYWHGTYVNRAGKMLFTHHVVDSLSAEELEKLIADAQPTGQWQFFAFKQPWPELRAELEARYA